MLIGKYAKNVLKGLSAVLKGNSMAPISTFYDPRYPPTKFLKPNRYKIKIRCIMCGFPRTGTHWIKNVIEQSTGGKTFEIFAKKPTLLDKNVILVKIHARNKQIAYIKSKWLLPPFTFGGKYIYVYRDPRDAIISLYEMYKKKIMDGYLTVEDFFRLYDPITQYRWEINAWVFRKHKNLLLVRFEELKQDPKEGFRKIFNFLDLDVSLSEETIQRKVAVVDSTDRPRGEAYGWKKAPEEYRIIIDEVSKHLYREIKALQYDTE